MYDWNDDRVIVSHQSPKILLTFDDGPSEQLPEILSILQEEQVQAIFFWQTQHVEGREVPWKDVLDQGHAIGNHSHSHPKLPDLSYDEQFREIEGSKKIIEELTGQSVTRFRPPYGLYNEDTVAIVKSLGLEIVLWKVASWDWKHETNEEQIVKNCKAYTEPGDIILLHELPQTVKVLKNLIQTLRKNGLQFASPHSRLELETENRP